MEVAAYNSTVPNSCVTLDYSPRSRGVKRVWVSLIGLLALVLVLITSLPLAANWYASVMYSGLKPGMTRANVDRHLWAFASSPTAYQGIGPGYFVVRYDFLWFGKSACIQVIYNPDGTVSDPQPIFDN